MQSFNTGGLGFITVLSKNHCFFVFFQEKYKKPRQKIRTPNEMQSSRSFEQEFIPEDLHKPLSHCTLVLENWQKIAGVPSV